MPSVGGDIAFSLGRLGLSPEQVIKRVDDTLQLVGLQARETASRRSLLPPACCAARCSLCAAQACSASRSSNTDRHGLRACGAAGLRAAARAHAEWRAAAARGNRWGAGRAAAGTSAHESARWCAAEHGANRVEPPEPQVRPVRGSWGT